MTQMKTKNVLPLPDGSGNSTPVWGLAALGSALVGIACVGILIWGVTRRLNYWDIQPFVLLIYGACLSAISASLLTVTGRRRGGSWLEISRSPRALLWMAVTLMLLWVWFPPTADLVTWWVRKVSWFKFGS